jgi:hypothetical protein
MRKLAPMFVLTTIALACGTAFAATGATNSTSTTDKLGAPTVDANTSNGQNLSYSDKSNTSTGTNARMDGKAAVTANQMPQHSAAMGMDEDDTSMTSKKTLAEKKKAEKMRMKKANVARAGDSTMVNRTPIDSSNGAAANSTTGSSAGQ